MICHARLPANQITIYPSNNIDLLLDLLLLTGVAKVPQSALKYQQ